MYNGQINEEGNLVPTEIPLSWREQFISGFILLVLTFLSLFFIIALWPDQVETKGTYQLKFFNVKMVGDSTGTCLESQQVIACKLQSLKEIDQAHREIKTLSNAIDSLITDPADTINKNATAQIRQKVTETITKLGITQNRLEIIAPNIVQRFPTLSLDTLILILVAAAGFLGNMIYLARSFTAFVGVRKFDRSWLLWYLIKPFTSSALAVIFYLLVNPIKSGTSSIYSIIGMAGLTGLFTDMALSKLKDIFEVIIKPNKDPLTERNKDMKIHEKNIKPDKIDRAHVNEITIPGENLDANNLLIKINQTTITDGLVTPTLIRFTYKVPDTDMANTQFHLTVTDKSNKILADIVLGIVL
jgi:hypothetical protein